MSNSWHVCSLVVQVNPNQVESIKDALCAMPDTEIPGANEEEGKLIVVMQGADDGLLYKRIESVREVPGVLAVSLVYHQQDDEGEEIA